MVAFLIGVALGMIPLRIVIGLDARAWIADKLWWWLHDRRGRRP